MYKKATIFLLVLGLCAAYSVKKRFKSRPNSTKRPTGSVGIFDGTNTTIQDHPYLVSIFEYGEEEGCSGAILNKNWVLVLGDCVYDLGSGDISLVAGSSDGVNGEQFSVEQVVVNPNYGVYLNYDYALLKVQGKFKWSKKVGKVTLPTQEPKVGFKMTVAGWGDTGSINENGGVSASTTLQEGTMKWFSKTKCQNMYENYQFYWNETMGCAYNKGKTTLCNGDKGNPFVHEGVIYGLAADIGDSACSTSADPVILADIFQVVDWIQEYIGSSEHTVSQENQQN